MEQDKIVLSDVTKAFLSSLESIPPEETPLEGERFEVSQTASLFGFAYEKLRNSVEFNEEHLIRRIAISRILKRRLEMNSTGKGEGESLARELMWGRYISSDTITKSDVQIIQRVINAYVALRQSVQRSTRKKMTIKTYDSIIDLMSCEIDEQLSRELTYKRRVYLYYFFQVLKTKIQIPNLDEETKDRFFYVAAERAYSKNDDTFIRYHLFTLKYGPLFQNSQQEIKEIARSFFSDSTEINVSLKNPFSEKLYKFARRQAAPFRILYSITDSTPLQQHENLFTDRAKVIEKIQEACKAKYTETSSKLRAAAIKSIIYIFLTKMIFVLILEFPLTRYVYGHIEYIPLMINTLFPPVLMGLFISIIRQPSSKNTQRITVRIIDILNRDPTFEKSIELFTPSKKSGATMLFAFTIFYVLLFSFVFSGIYAVLDMLSFNVISKSIFIFFLSVVAFFGYRIRQTAKEYVLDSENNIFISLGGFLFLPILTVGKILSSQISRINVFIILFDYIIEAPFKLFIDVFEEWSRYVKARKEELL